MEEVGDQECKVNLKEQFPAVELPGSNSIKMSDIDVLKDRMEQQKATKLKVEEIGSTLSRIKAREKASRRSLKSGEKKLDDVGSNLSTKRSGSNASNALKEKANLLKKKLEEDRAKFESKKGQEDLGRVSQIVEHIRVQLEDQDKTIQQMHNNFPANVKIIKEELSPPEPDIPAEIKQKISELEMKILDLQENLKEKDSVISARTQAITLLSEDMSRKGKNTLDTLEETRSQMRSMQANFAALEDRMGEERTRLRDQLDSAKLKLQQLDKNYRSAESARFDLSTRAAELQEKVVALQTKNLSLEEENKNCKDVLEVTESKIKELNEALENSNKQNIKIKAQFKAKLKSLEEERDTLRKEQSSNEEVKRLSERIAQLEDEKEAGYILKDRIAEMEEKLLRQENDLDSHVKALRLLEAEKLQLIEDANKNNTFLRERDSLVENMQAQINYIEELKVAAEVKCAELEEKVNIFVKSQNEYMILESELEIAKSQLADCQDTIKMLNEKLDDRQSDVSTIKNEFSHIAETDAMRKVDSLSSDLIEWQNKYSALEARLNSTLTYCEDLEERKKSVDLENENCLKEIENFKESIVNLQSVINSKELGQQDNIELKQQLEQKQIEITNLNKENKLLEDEVNNLRLALQSTTDELHKLYQQVNETNIAQLKVEELTSSLEERSRKLSEYKKFHKLKSEDVLRISHELESVTTSSQQRITELEESLNVSMQSCDELRKTVAELQEQLSKGPETVVDVKLKEQSLKMKKLAANLKLKTKLVKDLEDKMGEIQHDLQQKTNIIAELEYENNNLKSQSVTNVFQEYVGPVDNNNILEERCKQLEKELNVLRDQLKNEYDQFESLKECSNQRSESLLQIKELENQNMKLTDIAQSKSDQLRKMETEISELNGLNQSLMTELERMQDTYKQDALKNESVLDVFENEMIDNKNNIIELSNQLQDMSGKYQQAWTKLQEKEGYIEDIENQLEKLKSRLLQIESTVEGRRRSLEEKSEILGARLNVAEKNNEKLEKYEGELEQKIAEMINTEELLRNGLQKLQRDNNDMSTTITEAFNKNLQLSKELDNEQSKVKTLTNDLGNVQFRILEFEKMAEEFESLRNELKLERDNYANKINSLESQLSENEQCFESETQILLDKKQQLEKQVQEYSEINNSLLIGKRLLEEELDSIQKTILTVTNEELEQLKTSHNNLTSELNKELEKHQSYINRIQELESKVYLLSSGNSEEVILLKEELGKQLKENEQLKYEIVKENARQQVEDVVSKAEARFITVGVQSSVEVAFNQHEISNLEQLPAPGASNLDPLILAANDNESSASRKVVLSDLDLKMFALNKENEILKARVGELESSKQNIVESKELLDSEDWTSISKDEDDGWGWGSKDAILEQEHIQKQKVQSEREEMLKELNSKLCAYEEENKRLSSELKASQIKCTKFAKKLKEFKIKSDGLERNSRERSVGFDDLDLAMQDELKCQIQKLEKNLKESCNNLTILQAEKEGYLKKIEVLTSGNERLIEMKERQDIEVEIWQRKSNELQNKVQGLEWAMAELQSDQVNLTNDRVGGSGTIFTEEERQHFLANALEMEEKLNVLAAENEYLQNLVVELKEQDKRTHIEIINQSKFSTVDSDKNENGEISNLKQENLILQSAIKDLECKLQEQIELSRNVKSDDGIRIDMLIKENECLLSTIEELKVNSCPFTEFQSVRENLTSSLLENEELKRIISDLNENLMNLKRESDGSKVLSSDNSVSKLDYCIQPDGDASESPILFRGFTSKNEESCDISSGYNQPLFIQTNDGQTTNTNCGNLPASGSNFFDTIDLVQDFSLRNEEHKSENIGISIGDNVDTEINSDIHEISKLNCLLQDKEKELNNLLQEKETELNTLRDSVFNLQEENGNLKTQIQLNTQPNAVPWNTFDNVFSGTFSPDKNSVWGSGMNLLSKQLQEKNKTIRNLRDQLNHTTTYLEKIGSDHKIELTEEGSDLFSQMEDSRETDVSKYIEHITQLTKTQLDKEVEIEELTDKRRKCQELYNSLSKEYQRMPRHSDQTGNDQSSNDNVKLSQLLEDKETELEIMSQQIEQTIVAKENLQDELSMTLCEMEAAGKTYSPSEKNNVNLIPHMQPENIEEVRSLCAELEELTKLLQEKETEVEVLKQQCDETQLENENLRDEWKKEIEHYKETLMSLKDIVRELENEIKDLKEIPGNDNENKYKEELRLKDQQLIDTINELRNTKNSCQDLQDRYNLLENNLQTCNLQNENLNQELDDLRHTHNYIQLLTQEIGFATEASLVDKIKLLKDNLLESEIKLDEAKSEIMEKDKTILCLRDSIKTLEENNILLKNTTPGHNTNPTQLKNFASEPFRISTEQSSSDDDSSSKYIESANGMMKEIQSMKQVLSMKDAEITRLSIARNEAQERLIKNSEEENLRHRLDDALYTLHLRDVRCDELALELMQLLEERDSLQLKLSTAIRFTEELRQKYQQMDEESIRIGRSPEAEASTSETRGEDEVSHYQLKEKLDQLHNVGYRRDPGLQQDQQQRHLEQMHLYSHQSPPEETQSSGFFNWIFG